MQPRAPPVSPDRPVVRVLCRGFLRREGDVVVDASSNVTLVDASGRRVLVDTGSPADCGKLVSALRQMGLAPRDIDVVVNTHLHIDHCGCNDLFENAKVVAHKLEEPPVGNIRISGDMTLFPGVEIVPTPGHTLGSVSVFVSSDRRYAIAGDALPTKANYDSHTPPFIASDRRLALKSMDAIIAWADIVIPGHDAPFEPLGKKYVP